MPAKKQERAEDNAHDGDALDWVRELFGKELLRKREESREPATDKPEDDAKDGESQDKVNVEPAVAPENSRNVAREDVVHGDDGCFPEHLRNLACGEGGNGGREQGRHLEVASQQDFERERDGRERGLEKAREACRHACHEQNAGSVLHVNLRADVVAEGGANLHRHALAARTAPEEVRDPGRHHDERDEAERNLLLFAVCDIENDSHAAFGALADFFVREHDGNTAESECRNPVQRVCVTYDTDAVEHLAKECGKRTDDGAEEQGRNGEYRL